MLTYYFYLIRTAVMPLLFIPVISLANGQQISEPSLGSLAQPSSTASLPLGTLLDGDGKPINIPNRPQSAFNYSAPTISPIEPSKAKKTTLTKTSKNKKLRRKQLTNRKHVANDPSCRWLDQRMTLLEAQTSKKQGKTAKYQTDELNARQREWQCLKCGIEGPNQADYSRCQYRR